MTRLKTLAAAAVVFAACSGKLLTINIEQESSIVIEQGTLLENLVGQFGFSEFTNLDITDNQELQNQGVAPGDITDVYFRTFKLTATAPGGADLSFIENLEFYVEADGLDRVLVASQSDFPAGQASVDLNLEDVDLTAYVVSESMDLTTEVRGGRPDADTTVLAEFSIDVGATAQGACNQIKGSQQ